MKTLAGGSRWPNPATRQQYDSSTITTAALKWVLRNQNIATAIPGYTNYDHMKEDFSVAADLEYTDEEKQFLADNDVKYSLGFCRQCRQCVNTCAHRAEIPMLMRTHMYATQYGNLIQARVTLTDIPAGQGLGACADCSACSAACAHSVDIARRISELKEIYA
jgi:predicted aldo/keto reductase-like oxidoreductase